MFRNETSIKKSRCYTYSQGDGSDLNFGFLLLYPNMVHANCLGKHFIYHVCPDSDYGSGSCQMVIN